MPERRASGRSWLQISAGKLTLVPLIAATYCMVSGGPFGLEELVAKAGYLRAMLILIVTPLVWSLPTALMVSELASAVPAEGGFYIWVRRGMGQFWGFQEVWLTLAGSIFEMALYPTLCIEYLAHFRPALMAGHRALLLGVGMIVVCAVWNILGTKAVGEGSVAITFALLCPFAVLMAYALLHRGSPEPSAMPRGHLDILGGILIAMWNYMGWDNISTIAGEVKRPEKSYPRAMFGAVALVSLSYLLPVGAVALTSIAASSWSTGGWVDIGRVLGGAGLALAILAAGVIGATGTFNALMLSFSRLPVVMSEDGYLPRIFARRQLRTGAPWVAIVGLAIAWAACLKLGFERLVMLNVLLTGLSILLEFWALVALRIREPRLPRPYQVPGGLWGAMGVGLGPLGLIALTIARNHTERVGPISSLTLGLLLIAAGPLLYFLSPGKSSSQRHP